MEKVLTIVLMIALYSCSNTESVKISSDVKPLGSVTSKYNVQSFMIKANEDQYIDCEGGLQIFVDFIYEMEEKKTILMEVVECYKSGDIILNSLSTRKVSGEILETNGMVYINFPDISEDNVIKCNVVKRFKSGISNDYKLYDGVFKEDNSCVEWKDTDKGIFGVVVGSLEYKLNKKLKSSFSFSLLEYGWFNIDKEGVYEDVGDFVVNPIGISRDGRFALVFKNKKIASNSTFSDGKVFFKSLPLGEDAILIYFKRNSENLIEYSLKEVVTSSSECRFDEKLMLCTEEEFSALITEQCW